jgi:hypothetical protein
MTGEIPPHGKDSRSSARRLVMNNALAIWFVGSYRGEINFEVYDPKVHLDRLAKFLYWRGTATHDGTPVLIVGPSSYHSQLFRNAEQSLSLPSPKLLFGAGDVRDGIVNGWSSQGFELQTPDEVKPEILAALQTTDSERARVTVLFPPKQLP